MSRWFRLYDEILDDPKVQRLSGEDFKTWINLLCLASKLDGKLPSVEDMAFALRMDVNAVTTTVSRLLNGGLIEVRNGGVNGSHYAPYQWDKRQYKSDTSTDRVKRFRQRSRNVSEPFHETAPETDTETEKKEDASHLPKKEDQKFDEPAARGTRLSARFIPKPLPAKLAEQVRGWDCDFYDNVFQNFIDHWTAKPGKDGVKLDWDATWRTWLRNELNRQGGKWNGKRSERQSGPAAAERHFTQLYAEGMGARADGKR